MTKKALRDHLRKLGKKGGRATAKNRTPTERSDAARKAANARWKAVSDAAFAHPLGNMDFKEPV